VKLASSLSGGCVAGLACALVTFFVGVQHVQASSPDAWEEFQKDVKTACLRASVGVMGVTSIQVDPYGSESYGFAVIFGVETGSSKQRILACAYDKQSQTAEISSLFDR
jgi:hypothetical protein